MQGLEYTRTPAPERPGSTAICGFVVKGVGRERGHCAKQTFAYLDFLGLANLPPSRTSGGMQHQQRTDGLDRMVGMRPPAPGPGSGSTTPDEPVGKAGWDDAGRVRHSPRLAELLASPACGVRRTGQSQPLSGRQRWALSRSQLPAITPQDRSEVARRGFWNWPVAGCLPAGG